MYIIERNAPKQVFKQKTQLNSNCTILKHIKQTMRNLYRITLEFDCIKLSRLYRDIHDIKSNQIAKHNLECQQHRITWDDDTEMLTLRKQLYNC